MNENYIITDDGNQIIVGDVAFLSHELEKFNIKEFHIKDGAKRVNLSNVPRRVKVFLPDSITAIYSLTSEVEFDRMPPNLRLAYLAFESELPDIDKFEGTHMAFYNREVEIENRFFAGTVCCGTCGARYHCDEIHICAK